MELRHKTSVEDYIQASLLLVWDRPIIFIFSIVVLRVLLPMFVLAYTVYLFMQNCFLDSFIFLGATTIILLIGIAFLQKRRMVQLIEKNFSKVLLESPFLIEEKCMVVENQKVHLHYSAENKIDTDVKYILNFNQKFYLYSDNRVIDIIPENIFKNCVEKELFLKTINTPIKAVKRNILYWRLY